MCQFSTFVVFLLSAFVSASFAQVDSRYTKLSNDIQEMNVKLRALENQLATAKSSNYNVGTTFVRWGKSSCPNGASLVYKGITAGTRYADSGGAADYQCLPEKPQWGSAVSGRQTHGVLVGTEYEIKSGTPFSTNLNNHDVPCCMCSVSRSQHKMFPLMRICPSGWNKEYRGYLMSAPAYRADGYYRTTYICVDESPEKYPGGYRNTDGALLYIVEVHCGSGLPCPPYVDGYEATCIVCSK